MISTRGRILQQGRNRDINMVEASNSSSTVPDYKAFRQVATPSGCSMLNSNISTKDGTSFITCKNTAEGGTLHLYGSEVIN